MRTLLRGILLVAVFTVFTGIGNQPVTAQDKKKDAKKGSKGGSNVIEIAKGKDDKFRFFVRGEGGKLLAMSGPGGFASVKDAEKAIDELKKVIRTAKVVAVKKADTDKK